MANGKTSINAMDILVDNTNKIFTRSYSTHIKINKKKCFFTLLSR